MITTVIYYRKRCRAQSAKGKEICDQSLGDQMQSSKDPLPVDLHSMCLFPQQQVVRTLANFCPPGSSLETPRPRFYWELLTEAVSAWMTPYIQTPRRKAGVQMSWLSSWVSNSPCRFWICQTLHNHENKVIYQNPRKTIDDEYQKPAAKLLLSGFSSVRLCATP